MDAQGLTVRDIADQLGHARVSITQDTYFGRSMGPERARAALAGLGDLGISVDFSSSRTTGGEEYDRGRGAGAVSWEFARPKGFEPLTF